MKFATLLFLIIILTKIEYTHTQRSGYKKNVYDRENDRHLTREIRIKQGLLRGEIIEPSYLNKNLPKIERFLGIPYAAAPVAHLRFMPTGEPPRWKKNVVKIFDTLPPVCPQNLPVLDKDKLSRGRYKYLQRLLPYLKRQSEDCLYLNIYAPTYANGDLREKYPVMVFVHGESFEWNSGNPYDGSVLASYGRIIVVTFNFRLGILGFIKPGISDNIPTNFGLLDQIAALKWIQDNIAAFNGDSSSVTLMGHGTGAASVNLLMLSPLASANGGLFHKVILMSGSALSEWALVTNPDLNTKQIIQQLNCDDRVDRNFEVAECLREKSLEELLNVKVEEQQFLIRYGPIVDGSIIPDEPHKIMAHRKDLHKSYDLMFGLTELECYHLLNAVELTEGIDENNFEDMVRNYLATKLDDVPDFIFKEIIKTYMGVRDFGSSVNNIDLRDLLLDILSDGRVAAPLIQVADLHSAENPKSYFYIFGHNSIFGEYNGLDRSIHGEEIPFVFGIPKGGPKYHYEDNAKKDEVILSEQIMTYWTNFAKTGNPNAPRRFEFTINVELNDRYDLDWPEYDLLNKSYIDFGIPSKIGHHYREEFIEFWNKKLQFEMKKLTSIKLQNSFEPISISLLTTQAPKRATSYNFLPVHHKTINNMPTELVKITAPEPTKTTNESTKTLDELQSANITMNIIIALGILFLIVNILAFTTLYYKRDRLKSQERNLKERVDNTILPYEFNKIPQFSPDTLSNLQNTNERLKGCNIVKIIKSSTQSEDTYEAVKSEEKNEQNASFPIEGPLTRQSSTSTIDPNVKVRNWIAQEIVQKYSPGFLRQSLYQFSNSNKNILDSKNSESKSKKKSNLRPVSTHLQTLLREPRDINVNQNPVRPASPIYSPDSGNQSMHTNSTHDKSSGSGTLSSTKTGTLKKPKKVSVAVDATPAARSGSILQQKPIELTKIFNSDENVNFKQSLDVENKNLDNSLQNKANYNVDLSPVSDDFTVIKIEHAHSRSDPVDKSYYNNNANILKFQTFNTVNSMCPKQNEMINVNVTSRDEKEDNLKEISPTEALMTIKRRNYPKVLPDFPMPQENVARKRQSFVSLREISNQNLPSTLTFHNISKIPPTPPPRSTSTLGHINSETVNEIPEKEVTTLHVGPLIPKKKPDLAKSANIKINDNKEKKQLPDNSQCIKRGTKPVVHAGKKGAKRQEPKIIIKPTLSKKPSEKHTDKNIPHVTATDVNPNIEIPCSPGFDDRLLESKQEISLREPEKRLEARSRLPVLQMSSSVRHNSSPGKSSSDSSNSTIVSSNNSDTGTVVKRIL